MKKYYLFLQFVFIISFAQSQDQKISVEASYGFMSGDRILSGAESVLEQIATLGTSVERRNQTFTGPVGWTVKYHFSKTHAFGLTAGYEQSIADLITEDEELVGDFRRTRVLVAAEFRLTYLNAEKVQLYSNYGIGYTMGKNHQNYYTYDDQTNRKQHLAVYINPIGVRVGNTIGGFVELGYGYKGIINMGLSARF